MIARMATMTKMTIRMMMGVTGAPYRLPRARRDGLTRVVETGDTSTEVAMV